MTTATGCICPPTSEQTCKSEACPRKSVIEPRKPRVDLDANVLFINGKPIRLNPKEAEVAAILCRAYPGVARAEQIYMGVWGANYSEGVRANLSVQIVRLRKKLAGAAQVATVYKRGFKLVTNEAANG